MRLFSLLSLSLWVASALGQDESTDDEGLPPPGSPALTYTDGSFSEPNGGTASYNEGTRMNISWSSVYETTSVYLIVGYDWASPIQLTTNSAQSWFQWDVTTDSTNSTEVYVFRGVNGTGTAEQKAVGGFLSAAFNIPVKDATPTGPKQTFSTLSTSAGQPTQTSTSADVSQTSPTMTNTPGQEQQDGGVTEGAKIGIGVGVGVGIVGIAAFVAAFLFWRKSKKARQAANPQPHEMPLNGDFSPRFPPQQQQHQQQMYDASNHQQALAGYYKPPQHGETRGAELDGGQGYHFTAEANHDHMEGRSELQ